MRIGLTPLFALIVLVCVPVSAHAQNVVVWDGNGQYKTLGLPPGLYKAISAAPDHLLALRADGTVAIWTGTGSGTLVSGLTDVRAISAGSPNLALKTDGSVVSWPSGQNTLLTGPNDVKAIAAGSTNMALKSDGTVLAWTGSDPATAMPIGLIDIAAIGGGSTNIAVKVDGTVFAWEPSHAPQLVPALTHVKAVASGGPNLALIGDGTLQSWDGGQATIPAAPSNPATAHVAAVSAGNPNLALQSNGSIVAWGGSATLPPDLNGRVIAVAAGNGFSAALLAVTTVRTWGTGSGSFLAPETLNIPQGIYKAASFGHEHGIALKPDGTVVAWGLDNSNFGVVCPSGPCPSPDKLVRLNSVVLQDVIAIAAGMFHNLALKSDGTVVAWGLNDNGQRTVPVALTNPQTAHVTAISAGWNHSMALRSDGTVVQWGLGVTLGLDDPQTARAISIAAGVSWSAALKSDGTLVARNTNGAVGDPATVPSSLANPQTAHVVAHHAYVGNVVVGLIGWNLSLKSDGAVVKWPAGDPMPPANAVGVIEVGGGAKNLALKGSGTLVSWGPDTIGGGNPPSNLTNVVAVGGNGNHSLALTILPGPAFVSLEPATHTGPIGSQHCVTATVLDQLANRQPNIPVVFGVSGTVNTSSSVLTNAQGQTQFCYASPSFAGQDTITALADTNGNNTQDTFEPAAPNATKIWQSVLTTSVDPVNAGTVSVSAQGPYNAGTTVNVSATPNPGYRFVSWTGDVALLSSASTTVFMNASKSVTANFVVVATSSPVTINSPIADSYIRSGSPNQNQGAETTLSTQASGPRRILVRFDQTAIAAAVGSSSIASAKLRLYLAQNGNNWGATGRTVGVHRVTQDWTENGVTWNCSNDTIPANSSPNCAPAWDMDNFPQWPFVQAPTSTVVHTNGQTGWIEWDVTSDVVLFQTGAATNYGWIVRKMQENQAGHAEYSSRQGSNPPQLVITLGTPPASTPSLKAIADTVVKSGQTNQNQGYDTLLRVQDSGNNRPLVRFDQAAIQAAVGSQTLASAKLRLYIAANANNWGSTGRSVSVHRMTQPWTEQGATWNCANDLNPENSSADCSPGWDMQQSNNWPFATVPTATILHQNGQSGWVEWDVTSDIVAFLSGAATNHGWIVKKDQETQAGQADYSSRETDLKPELVITVSP